MCLWLWNDREFTEGNDPHFILFFVFCYFLGLAELSAVCPTRLSLFLRNLSSSSSSFHIRPRLLLLLLFLLILALWVKKSELELERNAYKNSFSFLFHFLALWCDFLRFFISLFMLFCLYIRNTFFMPSYVAIHFFFVSKDSFSNFIQIFKIQAFLKFYFITFLVIFCWLIRESDKSEKDRKSHREKSKIITQK